MIDILFWWCRWTFEGGWDNDHESWQLKEIKAITTMKLMEINDIDTDTIKRDDYKW